jgi:pyruvate dehydrogenase E2 component (dihydrolipoamide acetyltransferase)
MAGVAIPSIGIAMEEALLVRWHKQPGDDVAANEPVAEIETDKVTMDLESPVAGLLGRHLFEEGAIVPVGTVIVEVVAAGDAVAPAPPAVGHPQLAGDAVAPPVPAPVVAVAEPRAAGGARPHELSPRARRLAQEQPAQEQPAQAAAPQGERFRELIAAKVSESWRQIPHFAVTREVDAGAMQAALAKLRADGVEPAPTLTDLLLRALARALREVGADSQGDVGLAVATEHGVMIPVVRGVLALDAAGLATARVAAIARARAGKLGADDLGTAPSSTLSNLGAMGVDHFTGVIALGQTSLLTVGRAIPRVTADADHALRVRTTFHATLNADHRTLDGMGAARLLVAFTEAAEGIGGTSEGERDG